jgi:hypothetical protein
LNWQVRNITVKAQEVYRSNSVDPASRVRVAFLDDVARSFVDTKALAGHTYYYWIKTTDTKLVATSSTPVAITMPKATTTP